MGLGAGMGAGLTRWQAAALAAVAGWVWAASFYDLTCRTRALAQPWVTRRVHTKILSLKFLRHPTGMISLPLPAPHLHLVSITRFIFHHFCCCQFLVSKL